MIPVYYVSVDDRAVAQYAVERIGAESALSYGDITDDISLYVLVENSRYTLIRRHARAKPSRISLSPLDDPYFRARCEGKRGKELLPQAFGKMCAGGAAIADCTAGSGADGILLAARGAYVTLYEREPVAALLLEQTIADAAADSGFARVAARVTLAPYDALMGAFNSACVYDGYYLDPMFLKGSSAKAVKYMDCLQSLADARADAGGDALLNAALASDARRTVVKRPLKAGYINNIVPSRDVRSRNIRFDIYDSADNSR